MWDFVCKNVRKEKGKEVCKWDVLRKKGESKKGKRRMYVRFCT